MNTVTPKAPNGSTVAGFRVTLGAEIAEIEHTVSAMAEALHEPFKGRPDRMPKGACQVTWAKWYERSLPLALFRICQLILTSRRITGYGREWVRARVLQPLAEINGDVVIPRPIAESLGSADKEIAEASLAVSGALLAADRGAPRHERAVKIAAAKRELDDLHEVTR